MMVNVRRLLLSFFAVVAPFAVSCATGMADGVVTDILPAAATDPGDRCRSPDGGLAFRPDVIEICNGLDDNCDGRIDEGFDADGDGWAACTIGNKPADCDDGDRDVYPGAPEVCNGKDDDCDGKIDEDFDHDQDGFFTCATEKLPADCDDRDPQINPGAAEVCNGKDDDCDGEIDELPADLSGSLLPPIDRHWTAVGTATISSGWALLTPEELYASGALFWNATYVFDTFDVTATISIPAKSNGADGIAFAWVGGDIHALGASGSGYGVAGLPGYAVVIDTFSNPGEPTAPFLVVLDAKTNTHLYRQSVPEVKDGRRHELRVRLDGGKVSVWLDSINYVFAFPIPEYVPFPGHWGFVASTGALTSPHWVTDISMYFPNGQGCVP